jgi:hypothetical protein
MKKVDELTKNRREMDRENISGHIPRLFSEYMLTFRVEEPMKMCITN